jgi:galactokinase
MESRSQPENEVERAENEFLSQFGYTPSVIVAAPGRVNLIGEHVDYNDGFVLPMAIEQQVVIAAAERVTNAKSRSARIYSSNFDQLQTLDLDLIGSDESNWIKYIRGVFAGFIELGHQIPAFDAVIYSSVPVGGGLSSSAAIEVATATMLEEFLGLHLEPLDKALLCQKAEHEYAGVPCGIMDQFSSVFGKSGQLMLINCRSNEIDFVPFDDADVAVLITNSNVKHQLGGSEYSQRRATCDSALAKLQFESWRDISMKTLNDHKTRLTETEFRRALHVVTEIVRTQEAVVAIRQKNWKRMGELMLESHRSLRDHFEVSCRELDLLVDLANEMGDEAGVIGSRMTGGGFGGCTVSLIKTEHLETVTETIVDRYATSTGVKPECYFTRPSQGASVIKRSKQ